MPRVFIIKIDPFVHKFIIILITYVAFYILVMHSSGNASGQNDVGVVAVDVSQTHALALMSNGTVWAWGLNNVGQCGIDITNDTNTITKPVQVPGIYDVKAIASGDSFSMALKNDGTVWTWGYNHNGEMGIGMPATLTPADIYIRPTQVSGLYNVVAIDAGDQFAMALTDAGKVYTWGYNGDGELGNRQSVNSESYTSSPTEIDGLEDVKTIYAGPMNAMVLTKDGTLWAWGHASYILGERQINMTSSANSTPDIIRIKNVKSAAIGESHAAVLKSDGTVWTWGDDWRGKLGNGSSKYHGMPSDFSYTPIEVPGLTNVVSIAAGSEHTIALKDDGTVWVWGGNDYGQLGDGTNDDRNEPVKLPVSNITMISAGRENTITLDRDDVLKMSGDDTYGQLGDGAFANGRYKSSLQRVNFEFNLHEPSISGPASSPENSPGASPQEPLANNILGIAALLVIIMILGIGVLFYMKKK